MEKRSKPKWKNPVERAMRISIAHKGKVLSEQHRKKLSIAGMGRVVSQETRRKIGLANSVSLKGKKHDKARTAKKIGRKIPIEVRLKLSEAHKGEKHYNWKGGITKENLKIRRSIEYRLWRQSVFERDNYTCIWCGDNRGGNLNADHIKPFAFFPELRFSIDNGRTLCIDCHKTTDTYGNGLYYISKKNK